MASINQLIEDKFPINDMIDDLKRLTDNPEELKDYLCDTKVPMFIMTFNHDKNKIKIAEQFKNVCEIYYVCSTDDPYLETFKSQLENWENILIFSKEDYVGDISINGDDYGLTPPYNKSACFPRRFVSDYVEKNNIKNYILSDNDLIASIRFYNGKRQQFSDELLLNGIKIYFYLLEKYNHCISWINAVSVLGEIGGAVYKQHYIRPACLVLYFFNKPINWRGRYFEDDVTELLLLKENKQLAITFPYIRFECLVKIGEGDMSEAYNKLAENHGVECGFKNIKPARHQYTSFFFKDDNISGIDDKRLFYGKIVKHLIKNI